MHIEAILESGSIRSASRRLFVSQPSLSQYVKRLEDTLGCPIFDRSKSPWTLTEEGKYFVETERRIDAIEEERKHYYEDRRDVKSGEVVIGSTQNRTVAVLTHILPAFRREAPGVRIQIREFTSGQLAEAVTNGEVDCAFLASTLKSPGLTGFKVEREKILLAVPEGHRLAKRAKKGDPFEPPFPEVSFKELEGEPFIILNKEQVMRLYFDQLVQETGVHPNPVVETETVAAVSSFVREGVGLSFIPDAVVRNHRRVSCSSRSPGNLPSLTSPSSGARTGISRKPRRPLSTACGGRSRRSRTDRIVPETRKALQMKRLSFIR